MTFRQGFSVVIVGCILAASSCTAYHKGYDDAALKGREELLRQELKGLRAVIHEYTADKAELPQSLDDCVKAGYINLIPDDPITQKRDWKLVIGSQPTLRKPDGIVDVHSASNAKSSEGTLYSEW
jgi:general secretion pathway protein G